MKPKKLNLKQIEVTSFTTNLNSTQKQTVDGAKGIGLDLTGDFCNNLSKNNGFCVTASPGVCNTVTQAKPVCGNMSWGTCDETHQWYCGIVGDSMKGFVCSLANGNCK